MTCEAEVAHHIAGRIRLKVPGVQGNLPALDRIRASVLSLPGTSSVSVNVKAGSVLVHYGSADPDRFVSELERLGIEKGLFRVVGPTAIRQPASAPVGERRAARGLRSTESSGWLRTAQMRKLAGRSLLAVGIAGVLLPIVPGTPFLLAGAAVLGSDDPIVARGSEWIRSLWGGLSRNRH